MRALTAFVTFGAIAALSVPAIAGRSVTESERIKLVAALEAEGCTGGTMEFDDGKFEVDDAKCKDGLLYDLDFDTAFKLLKKKLAN